MQAGKSHRTVNNQLSVRGHHQAFEPTPTFNKHKASTGGSLNTSLGNWKTKPTRQSQYLKHPNKLDKPTLFDAENKQQNASQTKPTDYRGMTLQQYFRLNSPKQCKTEQTKLKENAGVEQEKDGELFGRLEIDEVDEDRYEEEKQEAETPDFNYEGKAGNNPRKQKISEKHDKLERSSKISSKLKTQIEEQTDPTIIPSTLNRSRLPSVLDNPTKTLRQQPPTIQPKRKRTVSNPHDDKIPMRFTFNDFYKFDNKNQKAMHKVKLQRQRAAELRINEMCLVTRYAQKFNINEAICRQIMRDQRQ